jgi:hypothetical protein
MITLLDRIVWFQCRPAPPNNKPKKRANLESFAGAPIGGGATNMLALTTDTSRQGFFFDQPQRNGERH